MPEFLGRVNTPNRLNTTSFLPRNLLMSSQKQPKRLSEKAAGKSIADPVERLNIWVNENWKQKSVDLCNKYTQQENKNKLSAKDQVKQRKMCKKKV
ncbi:hypothetical protein F8M41_015414 [Gigaspora margarita]|uniref:Uncharacterized protein n=1 Tax=Gigaspora margarita TaxID=4874 RepID=A0A8H3WVI4_GIGMA|nr:hypothetical protein F8M41_015414 [Gigaspora margarita]